MTRTLRALALALLGLGVVVAPSGARSLVERLPSGAALLGVLDMAAIRESPLVGRDAMDRPLPDQADGVEAVLRSAGIDVRRDIEQVAFAVMPRRDGGGDGDFAMIASGRLDPVKIHDAAIAHGGSETRLGTVPAIRLRDDGEGGPAFLSFVDGLAVLGGADATRLVHERGKAADSGVRRMPAEIPKDAAFWLAGDLGQMGSGGALSSSLPMMGQIQRIQLWARLAESVELSAIADAPDAAVATQVAGMAQLAAGFMALQAGSSQPSFLSGLLVSARDRRVTASLKLTKAQIDAMRADGDKASATPAAAPNAAAPKATP